KPSAGQTVRRADPGQPPPLSPPARPGLRSVAQGPRQGAQQRGAGTHLGARSLLGLPAGDRPADEALEGRAATLVKLGVKQYQADWRDPAGDGTTPVVVKITKPRRAKVVKLSGAERKRA